MYVKSLSKEARATMRAKAKSILVVNDSPFKWPVMTRAQAIADGIKHYFTGKACTHGHIARRSTRNNRCYECNRLYPKMQNIWADLHNEALARRKQGKAINAERRAAKKRFNVSRNNRERY